MLVYLGRCYACFDIFICMKTNIYLCTMIGEERVRVDLEVNHSSKEGFP